MNNEKEQKSSAAEFAKRWEGHGYEKGESQRFWLDLLENVYGVNKPTEFVRFEEQVQLDKTSFIDVMIPSTHVMIEQKSLGKDLRKPIRQSDGSVLTPFQQAQRYSAVLPYSERPRWIVTCNFAEFDVYDMENPKGEPQRIYLKDLERDYYRLQFLVETGNEHLQKEMEVSMKAGEIVGRIYDAFIKQYDANDPQSLRYLNILCVRLVFCLYAEDAGIFGKHDMFHDYLAHYQTEDMRMALLRLFAELNTPLDKRSKYDKSDLAAFPYTNGGLFAEPIEIPQFTDEIRSTLLQHASLDFDWSQISPTIFGGVFESTLNPETRRKGGMHYTSIENIHKVIDPLFFNDLKREFEEIMEEPVMKVRLKKLHAFQDKIASLKFLDPACGSGNFLTESYLSLRRLENEVIKAIYAIEPLDAFTNPIKVSINQFYGFEINDFAVTVATTALWISESQMMAETEKIIHHDIDFLPLKSYANIREGNALRMRWDVIEKPSNTPTIHAKNAYVVLENEPELAGEPTEYEDVNLITSAIRRGPKQIETEHFLPNYIIGNPPFVGARWMSKEQKEDVVSIFGKGYKGVGDLDYVSCWYKKAADLMKGTNIRACFVSTNSICQGVSVSILWKKLIEDGISINFAYRTFVWSSEAASKAAVHCVIVGFSYINNPDKRIFLEKGQTISANNINGYLCDAPDIFIEKRQHPICTVPEICLGGQPIDDGNFILTSEEKEQILNKEPQTAKYIRPFMMGKDFIDRKPRFCIWLKDASPKDVRSSSILMSRIKKVQIFRQNSKRSSTLNAANTPMLFGAPFECEEDYIAIPKVSSQRRKYIPMGYLNKEIIPGDKLFCMQGATLYHLGILESNVHMAWMRTVCGRLKSDYSYSNTIVYNNFPWPTPTESQKRRIEQTAQAILDVRAKYPDSSLADLYDPTTMPYDLLEAHRNNDRAVMAAYGFSTKLTESECVAKLLELYSKLAKV